MLTPLTLYSDWSRGNSNLKYDLRWNCISSGNHEHFCLLCYWKFSECGRFVLPGCADSSCLWISKTWRPCRLVHDKKRKTTCWSAFLHCRVWKARPALVMDKLIRGQSFPRISIPTNYIHIGQFCILLFASNLMSTWEVMCPILYVARWKVRVWRLGCNWYSSFYQP